LNDPDSEFLNFVIGTAAPPITTLRGELIAGAKGAANVLASKISTKVINEKSKER